MHHFPPNSTRRTTCRQGTIPPLRRAWDSSRPPRGRSPRSPRSLSRYPALGPATPRSQAGAMVSTAKTSLGRILRQLERTHALSVRQGQERQELLLRMCASFWPPLITNRRSLAQVQVPRRPCSGRLKARRRTRLVTYNHHPLYNAQVRDTKKGHDERRGSKRLRRNLWHAVSPPLEPGREEQRRRRRLLAARTRQRGHRGRVTASPGTRCVARYAAARSKAASRVSKSYESSCRTPSM